MSLDNMSRRDLLRRTAPLAFFAASALTPLGACSTFQQVASVVASDTLTIANGLTGVLAQLGTYSFVPAALISKVGVYIADVKSVATSLQTASASSATALVQQVETDVNAVVSALAGLPLPAPISTALQAASVLLPVIEAAVGLVVSQFTGTGTTTPAAAMRATAPAMTP
jgi:hypothetical protein